MLRIAVRKSERKAVIKKRKKKKRFARIEKQQQKARAICYSSIAQRREN
jgi:hypothetical protein